MLSSARPKPVLTVQVDVDTLQNLLQFYGFEATQDEDNAVYRLALPRFAELFKSLDIHATFFVIGKDLSSEANAAIVRLLRVAGHEIANHTHTHDYQFAHLDRQHKRNEIEQAGRVIENVTGHKPVGFRAPGYDVDQDVLESLIELGYRYDSSVLPSILNVPFKFVQSLMKENGTASGYGSAALSLAPNHPYYPSVKAMWRATHTGPLWEIPVSCVPYLRLPFYANFNLLAGDALFSLSSALATGKSCNYVFHAVEMLAPSEIDPRLHRHPNARLPLEKKIARCQRFLERLKKGRQVLLSGEFAAELEQGACGWR